MKATSRPSTPTEEARGLQTDDDDAGHEAVGAASTETTTNCEPETKATSRPSAPTEEARGLQADDDYAGHVAAVGAASNETTTDCEPEINGRNVHLPTNDIKPFRKDTPSFFPDRKVWQFQVLSDDDKILMIV